MADEGMTADPESVDVADSPAVVDEGGWMRGADDAIVIAIHLGGAFTCRNYALSGQAGTAEIIAVALCLFAIVFSSFFSNVSRLPAQITAFVVHVFCILGTLLLFAPQTIFEGLGAFAGLIPSWMAALFGSAMGSLAATGIGDVSGD